MGSGGTASPSLVGTTWTQEVNVTLKPFWPWKRILMHGAGGWVGHRTDMDVYEGDNISCLDQDSNSDLSNP